MANTLGALMRNPEAERNILEALNQLQPTRSFGFAGAEGAMFDQMNQPQNNLGALMTNQSIGRMQPQQNYMQRSGGERIDLGPSMQSQGIAKDYGRAKVQLADGRIGYRSKDNPAVIVAEDDSWSYDMSKRAPTMEEQMARERFKSQQLENQQKEAQLKAGNFGQSKAPSGYRFSQDGGLEPIPGGPADLKAQMLQQQKGMASEQANITTQQVLDQAAMLYQHPGRSMATGASSFMSAIPGTNAKGFEANLDTFKAQTFIPMVSALKGMGALSDAEGKKLAESVGALNREMPEDEFAASLQTITKTLYDKAKASGLNVSLPEFAAQGKPAQTQAAPKTGEAQDGYIFLGGNPADPSRWRKQ